MDSFASLIELIFAKCSLVYGREFLGRWEGQDIGEVKADWRRELGGLLGNPQVIRHALEHLPANTAPTVLQFRSLCIGPPGDRHESTLRLKAPSVDPKVIAAAKTVAHGPKSDADPKAWAWRLRKRDQQGERLSQFQRAAWREALKSELSSELSAA